MESDPHIFARPAGVVPAGASLLARDGAVLSLSGDMAALFGRAGLEGMRLQDLIDGADRERVDDALARLRAGRESRIEIAVRLAPPAEAAAPVRLGLEALRDHGETVVVLLDAGAGQDRRGTVPRPPLGAPERAAGARVSGAGERVTLERFDALDNAFPGALFELNASPDGRVRPRYTSARFADVAGVERARVARDALAAINVIDPEDRVRVREKARAAAAAGAPFQVELRIAHPSKGPRWVMSTAAPVAEADGSVTWFGTLLDITEMKAAEHLAIRAAEALSHAHARLTYLTDGATVGLLEARMHPGGRMTFPYASARFQELTGLTGAGMDRFAKLFAERIDPRDLARLCEAVQRSHRDRTPVHARFRLNHPERGPIWLEASAGVPTEQAGSFTWVGALHDVTNDVKRERDLREAHRLAEEMRVRNEAQAMHDGLTGLPNRRYFDDMIAERRALALAGGPGDCTLVRLDLDRFKHVNDTLGHAAGDLVLKRVADVLRDCVRVGDFPSRNGGDEFSVLMAAGASAAEAREVVGRIQSRLAEPLLYEGRQCRFGTSFGIAHTDDILDTGDDIHLFADAALHRAKVDGGNRTETFTPRFHSRLQRDRNLAIALHEALEKDELVPYFQPQIRAADGSLYGAEVLLRWNHPSDGIIAPGAFMHVAEQLRLVPDIDRIVMEKSCDVLSRWRTKGLIVPKISLNVSSGRMHDPGILEYVDRFARIDTRLTFELLESILIEEENQAFRDNVNTIRAAGVDIEIDDFGSGHASIIGLMAIEPSALKIDQRIVFPVVHEARARDLVHGIVEIARALGIRTVAEGVETADHVRILRDLGCDVLQGYHFARPLDEAQFLAYALSRQRSAT